MVLEFLGAAHEVTGSCHYLSFGDKHILVDCGMEQTGKKDHGKTEKRNRAS